MPSITQKKEEYANRMFALLDSYTKCFVVQADNVGSYQFLEIRRALREKECAMLMGKNTLMKRCVRLYCDSRGDDKWKPLVDILVGNVGLVFVKGELTDCRDVIGQYKVPAPARVGAVAQCNVTVPAGPTGMDPSQTSFFQMLNIATKINKGSVEILNETLVLQTGDKVGSSEAALLQKMGIKPFTYGLELQLVLDNGNVYDPKVLDLTDEDMLKSFGAAAGNVAALSLALAIPNTASIPHMLANAYKNVLAVSVETDYTFPAAQKIKDFLANPSAFMVAAAPAAAAPAAGAAAAAAPEPEEEEEEEDMGFDLFD